MRDLCGTESFDDGAWLGANYARDRGLSTMDLGKDQMLEMYRAMTRIRLFEAKVRDLATANEIPGFVHVSIGEEASAAGTCAALRKTDRITSTHRGHGHLSAKGRQLNDMRAESYGKRTGYCEGECRPGQIVASR